MDTELGLSDAERTESKKRFGENLVSRRKRRSFLMQFISNLGDPIIRILIGAMIINIIFMFPNINIPETAGIAAAVFVAAFVSTVSEYGSEKAFEKLNEESSKSTCMILKDGKIKEVTDTSLVCGDVIIIEAGSTVPADAVIISGNISVNQAPLTGESVEIKKSAAPAVSRHFTVFDGMELSASDPHQVFRGCLCTGGEAVAVVCRVGDNTFYGSVAKELQKDSRPSPLKDRLSELANSISVLGYIAAGLIMAAYLFNTFVIDSGFSLEIISERIHDLRLVASSLISAVTLGVSVIVVAVPEGLPMMITVVLSSNMKKMLNSGVLVRKMVGIETAGSMNILFTDKTGTLTTGNMTLSKIICPETVFSSSGEISKHNAYKGLIPVITNGLISSGKKTPTERAVLSFFKKQTEKKGVHITERLPFNSRNKYSACKYISGGAVRCAAMGAAEKLLKICDTYLAADGTVKIMDEVTRRLFVESIYKETTASSRVLAVVIGDEAKWDGLKSGSPKGLTAVMLLSIKDELRRDIKQSVHTAKSAGVHVVMITGDNRETAVAIAKEAGITDKEHDRVITGEEMARMTDEELISVMPRLAVVSRALPSDKLRLVELSGKMGLVSGMTGDGINDAPSLKAADVGFAMGSGSDVAKEAADIILTNNSFYSITRAILYGRTVFESIRKFIIFQLTMNLCALGVSLVGPFIGVETPITVIQMLWVNIIMDTLGGLAFAGEIPLSSYMRRPPIDRKEKILNSAMICQILFLGTYTLGVCLVFLKLPAVRDLLDRSDELYFLTCFFALFIFCGIFNSFNARAPRGGLLSHLAGNKAFIAIITFVAIGQLAIIYFGGEIFRATPLSAHDLAICALLSFSVIPADQIRKLVQK